MGLLEESTWGAEKSGKSVVKRLSQKRREECKRKSNILNPKISDQKTKKNKKKKNKSKTDFQSFIETGEKESPKNVKKVQNSEKQSKNKSSQNNINSPKSSKNVKMGKKFSKTDFKSKKKLKIIQSTESLKNKSIQEQEINRQSITPLKVKKRKQPEIEEEVEQVTKFKKRKKSKTETNKSSNFTIEISKNLESSISEGTPKVLKNKKRKNKKKTQNGKIKIKQNLKSQKQNNDSVKKISINKIQEMIKNKHHEIKERKLDSSLTLRERMLAHLRSSRFRFINESLYNSESSESKEYFKEDPEAFVAYHEGYRQQVAHWPLNPVDIIIASIKKMPKDYILADFGCGEAKLANSVSQTVHSFDLVAMNDKVKACDMAHTPLLTNGVNVVVFCLSLMGTNLADYLLEANRVLKKGGIMKIAEVESRFDNIENFINLVSWYGFVNTWTDFSNDLFYFLDFKKENDVSKGNKKLPVIELKTCLYKKR